jgi:predicted esterase
MVTFLAGYKRWAGYTISDLRRTEVPEDLGMIKTEMVIGGWKRHWWTFEPTDYKLGKKEKYPLVVAIHGFTCSGEFFANNADWHYVGEQRGAIIVYPTATPFTGSPNGPRPPHFTTQQWNCGLEANMTDPAGPDELEYFRILLDETKKKYPIDPERIYVTGHSNGGMMTQYLMRYMPGEFAGFAPVGFMEDRNHDMRPEPDDGIIRNIWFTMGEYDLTGMELTDGNANSGTVRKLCEHNGLDYGDSKTYVSGNFVHTIWRDQNKVPLVRFTGVVNWPHTYSPEVAFLIYDEFFSRFVRHSDGTLEYLA